MKTFRLLIPLIVFPFFALAQVGIGTISPNAQLEITSSNQATPANNDGLLIPKIDEFPAMNPTAAQNGMMVFVTGNGTPAQGFYYWNNGSTSWENINTGADSVNELSDGKSDADGTEDGASIFLGVNAGLNDDETNNYNVGIGRSALSANVSGFWNTAVGYVSLSNNTGSANTAVGYTALSFNSTGNFNTALGASALSSNTTGTGNLAIGYRSLQSSVNGSFNLAIGYDALTDNTNGANNIAIGRGALQNANTLNNLAIGTFAMRDLTSGINNVALGINAQINNETGDENVALGVSTLRDNTAGNQNVAIGHSAGLGLNGTGNTVIGSYARSGLGTTGNYNVFLGYSAGRNSTGSNQLYIENSDSATPLIYGEFDNDILRANGTFQIGDPSGTGYAFPAIDGTANQVLQSDGAGSISWQDISPGAEQINDLTDARSDNDGTDNGSSIFFGIGTGINDDQTANNNVGIGYFNLNANTSGQRNVALGSNAMRNNTTGYGNVAVGYQTLQTGANAINNTALGSGALYQLDSGVQNVALGYSALSGMTSGSFNVAIGRGSGAINNGTRNVFIGDSSGSAEAGSNKLYIENTGADQNSALIYGEFDNDILRTNGTLQIGNPSTTGFAFPAADGTANQVLQTNGSGSVSWQNISTGADRINGLIDGRSDNDGTDDGSSIFLGVNAGASDNSNNNLNVGIGYQAMQSNVSGQVNTAIGYQSLNSNTTGNQNTAVGYGTLQLANGTQNTALGLQVMRYTTSGIENVGVGAYAMTWNRTGSYNTGVGKWSLTRNESGQRNTALGYGSGYYVEDGTNNTFLGYQAGFGSTPHTISGSVFLGYQAGMFENSDNKLYIDNSNTSSPLIYGDFSTNLLRVNGTLNVNSNYSFPTIDGTANQVLQTDGAGNISWANVSGADNDWTVVGSNIERQAGNVYIGDTNSTGNDLYINDRIIDWDNTAYYLDPDGFNRLDEVSLDPGSASDPSVTFGDSRTGFFSPGTNMLGVTINNTERMRINASGQVGINTTNPAYDLEVGGAVMLEDTAIPGHVAGHSGVFSRSGELYAIDSAGNLTVISPHHFELVEPSDPMAWSFYSENLELNRKVNVDMYKLVQTVEQLSGEKLLFTADLEGNEILENTEIISLKQQVEDQQAEIDALKAELAAIKEILQKQD